MIGLDLSPQSRPDLDGLPVIKMVRWQTQLVGCVTSADVPFTKRKHWQTQHLGCVQQYETESWE